MDVDVYNDDEFINTPKIDNCTRWLTKASETALMTPMKHGVKL